VDEKSIPQLLELIREYDPDIIWFDTPHKLPPEENLRILAAVRKAKPSLVINGRLVGGLGDYASTCDRPAEFPPQKGDWEGVPTTNESYGYNENDKSHKPASHFIQLLAKSAARGGNQLMNIGPMGDGRIDPADAAILEGIGKWWAGQRRVDPRHRPHAPRRPGVGRVHPQGKQDLSPCLRLAKRRQTHRRWSHHSGVRSPPARRSGTQTHRHPRWHRLDHRRARNRAGRGELGDCAGVRIHGQAPIRRVSCRHAPKSRPCAPSTRS
jgi:hypothetical protein